MAWEHKLARVAVHYPWVGGFLSSSASHRVDLQNDSGFGVGISQSALFISLQAVVDPNYMAPAVSMMYMSTTICMMTGLVSSSAVMQGALRHGLENRLRNLGLDSLARKKVGGPAVIL